MDDKKDILQWKSKTSPDVWLLVHPKDGQHEAILNIYNVRYIRTGETKEEALLRVVLQVKEWEKGFLPYSLLK